jgi:hypothetical protein
MRTGPHWAGRSAPVRNYAEVLDALHPPETVAADLDANLGERHDLIVEIAPRCLTFNPARPYIRV